MPHDSFILTTKDFTILEVMFDRGLAPTDAMTALLRRKLQAATVVFRDDIPPYVATLSSRISFSVDAGAPDSRILSHDRMNAPTGLFLPITTIRGLALLGLSEGQAIGVPNDEGTDKLILLEQVLYQPEAARREKDAIAGRATPEMRRASLRVIPGALAPDRRLAIHSLNLSDDGDDPGPTAA
ncbi:nucleoside-diphosphate kinase [Mesorhizobium sp. CN2-181]|uniref:nucleoside-diphosphate kinase n=1 Tax=Mesorhizobium yinganensis TaxID=3157707 RepID=UPI0032B7E15B